MTSVGQLLRENEELKRLVKELSERIEMPGKQPTVDNAAEIMTIVYRNWKGQVGERRIWPKLLRFGTSQWHKEPQWLMLAFDIDKEADREFALKDCVFADEASQVGKNQVLKPEEKYQSSGPIVPLDEWGERNYLSESYGFQYMPEVKAEAVEREDGSTAVQYVHYPTYTGPVPLGKGWFALGAEEARNRSCATEGCEFGASFRLEAHGIGANYCAQCATTIGLKI